MKRRRGRRGLKGKRRRPRRLRGASSLRLRARSRLRTLRAAPGPGRTRPGREAGGPGGRAGGPVSRSADPRDRCGPEVPVRRGHGPRGASEAARRAQRAFPPASFPDPPRPCRAAGAGSQTTRQPCPGFAVRSGRGHLRGLRGVPTHRPRPHVSHEPWRSSRDCPENIGERGAPTAPVWDPVPSGGIRSCPCCEDLSLLLRIPGVRTDTGGIPFPSPRTGTPGWLHR
ncbi:collagen alpha-1(I) chain-like isoform X2 [Mustela putorius furo]|uniref:Collagen alpha-1(I) chain-like isoform X2 n=1 Tax=Mustela putorius furo TaxID=9669 RepID=A0A8U0V8R1_MUSPF|nr:collagen alpha-1(I) chain-like isoform X2 [Mustela putorius furo]